MKLPKDAKVIVMGDHKVFWSKDGWITAYDAQGREVTRERLLQLQLLHAHGADGV